MSTVDADRPGEGTAPAYETRHDLDGAAALSETVIEAVAAAEGVDPTDCDLELYEAVDLEALDTLFDRRCPEGHWRFEFSIDDYLVVVAGDGSVTVREHAAASGSARSRDADAPSQSTDAPSRSADATEGPE